MTHMVERIEAIREVAKAAGIHAAAMEDELENRFALSRNEGFRQGRREYIRKVRRALSVLQEIRFDGETKLKERLDDLGLEESVDLQLAVEERIRLLRHRAYQRTEF